MKKKPINYIVFYTIAAVAVSIYFFPMISLFLNSFKDLKDIYLNVLGFPTQFNFKNYKDAIEGMDFFRTLLNSVVISGTTAVFTAFFSAMAGWALERYKRKVSTVIYMLLAGSMLIPFQCVMLPLIRLLKAGGMMNRLGLIFSYIGLYSSMCVILVAGYVKSIPVEVEEAALIDGCNSFQVFFHVVFPLLKPILVTVLILSMINTWCDYLLPSLIINRAGMQTLPLKTYSFISQFVKRWELASAGMVLCNIPAMIFYILCQKEIINGVTTGAVKG